MGRAGVVQHAGQLFGRAATQLGSQGGYAGRRGGPQQEVTPAQAVESRGQPFVSGGQQQSGQERQQETGVESRGALAPRYPTADGNRVETRNGQLALLRPLLEN